MNCAICGADAVYRFRLPGRREVYYSCEEHRVSVLAKLGPAAICERIERAEQPVTELMDSEGDPVPGHDAEAAVE